MATVNVSGLKNRLKSIHRWMKDVGLGIAAEAARQEIIDTTVQEIRPSRTAFYPVLTRPYSKIKERITKNSLADMRLTNTLIPSMEYNRVADNYGILTVPDDQQPKLHGLTANGRPLFETGEQMKRKINVAVQTGLKEFVKR